MQMRGGEKMNKKIFGLAALVVAGTMALFSVTSADAFGGHGPRGGEGRGFGLISQEMREEFREDWQNLTEEEKDALRQEREERREEHRAEMEEFLGMTRDEMREAHLNGNLPEILEENGVTQEEAEAFLTEKANEKVEIIAEKHELTEEQEQSIRDRIAEFVQVRLDRWFGN